MIRLQDNVPTPYINESRDFQLFLRLYDCLINGVKFDIDTMIYLFDPFKVNNRMLELLASKVGFFPKTHLNDMMMRYIIAAFPYLMKYKGSKKGIEGAIATILKADNIYAKYTVSIYNNSVTGSMIGDDHVIQILIDTPYDKVALQELLNYICPLGYLTELGEADSYTFSTELDNVNILYTYIDPAVSVSQVANNEDTVDSDWILPSYTLTKDAADQEGTPYREISETNEKLVVNGVEKTYKATRNVYVYWEKEGDQLFKKTLTVIVPNTPVNRYRNTLNRLEVIGSNNDLSLNPYENGNVVDGLNIIDSSVYKTSDVISDVGEQSNSTSVTFDLQEGQTLKDPDTYTPPNYPELRISGNIILGFSSIKVNDNIRDNQGSIARIISVYRKDTDGEQYITYHTWTYQGNVIT